MKMPEDGPSKVLVIIGIILIAFGATSLFSMVFGPIWSLMWGVFRTALSFLWPLGLVAFGIFVVYLASTGALAQTDITSKKLYRSRTDSKLGGVLGGLATYLELDPTVVRLVYVLAFIVGGFFPFGVLYILLWIIVPEEPTGSYA